MAAELPRAEITIYCLVILSPAQMCVQDRHPHHALISSLLMQVVCAAAVDCIKSGIATSGEVGRSLHAFGQPAAFGLQPGYLFGRDMVGGDAHSLARRTRHLNQFRTHAALNGRRTCLTFSGVGSDKACR